MLKRNLVAAIVFVAVSMTGSMLYVAKVGAEQDGKETFTNYEASQNEFFLARKGKNYVLADEMRFEVDASTVIKNWRGDNVTLAQLQVPSKAVIKYYYKTGHANAYIATFIQEILVPE